MSQQSRLLTDSSVQLVSKGQRGHIGDTLERV